MTSSIRILRTTGHAFLEKSDSLAVDVPLTLVNAGVPGCRGAQRSVRRTTTLNCAPGGLCHALGIRCSDELMRSRMSSAALFLANGHGLSFESDDRVDGSFEVLCDCFH